MSGRPVSHEQVLLEGEIIDGGAFISLNLTENLSVHPPADFVWVPRDLQHLVLIVVRNGPWFVNLIALRLGSVIPLDLGTESASSV